MPEMLKPTAAIMGAGLGNDVALITDGGFLEDSWLCSWTYFTRSTGWWNNCCGGKWRYNCY